MPKKSRRFIAGQAARERQRKKTILARREQDSPTAEEPALAKQEEPTAEAREPAKAEDTGSRSEPAVETAPAAAPVGPWRYGYVMSDIRRIVLLGVATVLFLIILSFIIG